MTPGALLLRMRQKFGHGLRAAWYRDVIRPRILQTAPVAGTTDATAEIHLLTRAQDHLDAMWALKSFYRVSPRRYRLCIHDDGSLLPAHCERLQEHFPDARLVRRAEADRLVFERLASHPRCLEFRRTNVLAPKVFDFCAYLSGNRLLMFDSDLLFFAEPARFLQRVNDPAYAKNAFNADCADSYTVEPAVARGALGHELLARLNSGLGLVHKESLRFDWIEEFLGLPGVLQGHFWRIEQTLIALCSSKFGAELLPDEYTLRLGPGIGDRPFRHYVGRIRHLMYKEGLRRLVAEGFLGR